MQPSGELLRALLAAAPDALIAVDQAGQIVYVNDRVEPLFGWRPHELLDAPVETLVPEEARRQHAEHRGRYAEAPSVRPMGAGLQLSALRKDGSRFPVEISLSTVAVGASTVVLVAVRDVSERVELEAERRLRSLAEQREQSHRLESLGQLAGGVAHDFNNLLGVIMNYATLVARRIDDPVAVADLEEIRAAAERAVGLTGQLLTFASREAVHHGPLDVNRTVQSLAAMLERTLAAPIHQELALWPAPLVAAADRNQVEQIVVNLVVNARDAMPDGGTVTLATRPVPSEVGPPGVPDVELVVRDDGSGMSPETRARAFEPFFTTKAPGEGTGLGLAIVYGIVQQSGGSVSIESEPGHGTAVTIRLPGAAGQPAAPPEAPSLALGGGHERVLVVEDESALRVGTARLLGERGYEVLTAVDGVEALELIEAGDPRVDLVLTDVVMPRMRGDQLARVLAERHAHLPVILMSGYPWSPATETGRLLPKPVVEEELLHTIREALDVRIP